MSETPPGCGISRAPDGSFLVKGDHAAIAAWWIRDMKYRELAVETFPAVVWATVKSLHEFVHDEVGIIWIAADGSPHCRAWDQVHRDLGEAFLRASRSEVPA